MKDVPAVRLVCQNCGYRAAPGMGYCLRCDTLNPEYEEEEEDTGDRDLTKT